MLMIAEVSSRIVWTLMPHPFFLHDRLFNDALLKHSWFSRDFFEAPMPDPAFWTPPGTLLLFPRDFQSNGRSVLRGVRATEGFSPDRTEPDRVVAVLGGSTVYCAEVPDRYTLPSQIQRILASRNETSGVRILNWGVSSVHSMQEFERLKYEVSQGNKPDAVIFFHGVNDVFNGIFNGEPESAIMVREQWEKSNKSIVEKLSLKAPKLYRTLMGYYIRRPWLVSPAGLSDQAVLKELARKTAQQYRRSAFAAYEFCKQHQIECAWVLQPAIPTISRSLNAHEKQVMANYSDDVFRSFEAGYPLIREVLADLRAEGALAIDGSDLLDNNGVPVFLDFCHVESDGNAILAQGIVDRLPYDFWTLPESTAGD